jgi:DNA-binding MarR family transcriptional regulator/predicted N-acetyltransferase YhbS
MPDGAVPPPPPPPLGQAGGGIEGRIAAIRAFGRFYTRRVGALRPGLLGSGLPLAEARILYETAQAGPSCAAADLARALGLDQGHLSRVLRRLEARGLLARRADPADARRARIAPTRAGRAAFARLDRAAHEEVAGWLAPLAEAEQRRLVAAMAEARRLLDPDAAAAAAAEPEGIALRPHRAGDIGWVVERHGALYAAEYGWDSGFEALVAEIGAAFLRGHDPARERCWIAEEAATGRRLGSVMIVRGEDAATAKLRLLLVEPEARGRGLGRRLVAEAEAFARAAGYAAATLWTNACLLAARRIYAAAGWRLTRAEPYRGFGQDLVGETWDKALAGPDGAPRPEG